MVRDRLAPFGIQVVAAASVAEAIHVVASAGYDVVVVELELPDGSGLAVLDELERCGPDASLPRRPPVRSAWKLDPPGGAAQMADDDIQRRLLALEDRLAIIELESAYCRWFDARDGNAWAALFTEDGIYRGVEVTADSPRDAGVYCEGRAALRSFCNKARFTGIHFMHLPQLTIEGDAARGRVHFEHVGAFEREGGALHRAIGYGDTRYERVDGQWLFAEKVTTTWERDGVLFNPYLAEAPPGT